MKKHSLRFTARQIEKEMQRPKCIKDRCWSPVACSGFGYCRELNMADDWPHAAENSKRCWEEAIRAIREQKIKSGEIKPEEGEKQ